MHKIELAAMGKRALAAVIDVLIFLALWTGVFALCVTAYTANDYTRSLMAELNDYQVSSGLYYLDDNGNATQYDYAAYDSYQSMVVSYYTDYLVKSCPEAYRDSQYTIYWYNVHILGLADVKGIYGDLSSRLEPSLSQGAALFQYSGTSYDALGIPASSLYTNGELTTEAKAQLLSFYWSASARSVYYNAGQDLYNRAFYQETYILYEGQERTYPLITAVPLASLIYYLIIPLCFSDGETLGKYFFKLCLVNSLGFKVKKSQVVLRQLPSLVFGELSFVLLNPAPAATLWLGVLAISYGFVLFDKSHRALHDLWSGTLVIDKQNSLFYRDAHDQELGEAEFQSALAEAENLTEEGKKAVEDEKIVH
jgi:uncharacterized RDD family membrane protein YckC